MDKIYTHMDAMWILLFSLAEFSPFAAIASGRSRRHPPAPSPDRTAVGGRGNSRHISRPVLGGQTADVGAETPVDVMILHREELIALP